MAGNKCIYCNATENLCRSAHVLPRGMGAFENQPTLKNRVCQECDREIGRYEEQFMKCGPEGFLRAILGIQGRSKTDPASLFRRKYAGHGPMSAKVKYPGTDYEVLWEPISGSRKCKPLPQLVVVDKQGNCSQILLTNTQPLKEKLSKIKIDFKGKFKILPFGLTEQEFDQVVSILKELKLFESEDTDERLQPCNTLATISVSATHDKRYFQAIAKISFHYFLQYTNYFNGLESCFESIRQFIRCGMGEVESFITKGQGYLIPELRNWHPQNYGHVIISDFLNNNVEVRLQFFIGPVCSPILSCCPC